MGLLDDLKPPQKKPKPRSVSVQPGIVAIDWDDGRRSLLPFRFLRASCPCAGCVDEWTGQRTLDPATIPTDVKPWNLGEVGRYAVQIEWSDGHASGIYSWDLLGRLAAEAEQAKAPRS
jgi:DUF971 family protein